MKISLNNGILLKEFQITNWLSNRLASCSLRNLHFLLAHTAHLENSMIVPFLVFLASVFSMFAFFLHYKQYDNILL